ncbi:M20/M25/M40 family metallo-hydrolase [Methylobacterium durans]|uniref:M20/M25/M40 family metallo-hydrolase n=1 Tax=Methylobacterium durans TaxID=2202825 RepID=UPI003AAA8ECA
MRARRRGALPGGGRSGGDGGHGRDPPRRRQRDPGEARFSLDLRAPDDARRLTALADIEAAWRAIADRRGLGLATIRTHEAAATPCDPCLTEAVAEAIAAEGHAVLRLPSGAGHDGMAVAALAPIAMIFVRCRGGISHNPAEFASLPDIEVGARVMLRTLRALGADHVR